MLFCCPRQLPAFSLSGGSKTPWLPGWLPVGSFSTCTRLTQNPGWFAAGGGGWVGQGGIWLFSVFSLVGFLGCSYAYVNISSLCSPTSVVFPGELILLLLNDDGFFFLPLFIFKHEVRRINVGWEKVPKARCVSSGMKGKVSADLPEVCCSWVDCSCTKDRWTQTKAY